MKTFWTAASILAIAAAGGWYYRDKIPYLDQVPYVKDYIHTDGKAVAQSDGAPTGERRKGGNQGAGQTQSAENGQQRQGQGQGQGQGGARRGGGPATVKTIPATMATLPMDVTATGWAQAADTTTIAALQQGLVMEVVARDGQEIKMGDLIAKLDDRAALATVNKDKANIAADQASLAEYEAAFQRAESLVKQNAQSQQTYEQTKAARDSAAAKVDADKATLASDMVALEHMEIRAPYNGRLGDIMVSPGAYVSAGATIVTITKYDPIYVQFRLSQRYLPQLHEGLRNKAPVDADPAATGGFADRGTLTFFDNVVDQSSGTVSAKAEFKNDKGTLWPGQSVNVTARFTTNDRSIVVPTVAVRPGNDGFFVYTVDADKKVHATKVKVARANGDMTAIASGLNEGDHIVVEGQVQLANGQQVVEQFAGAEKVAVNLPAEGAAKP